MLLRCVALEYLARLDASTVGRSFLDHGKLLGVLLRSLDRFIAGWFGTGSMCVSQPVTQTKKKERNETKK